MIGMGKTKRKRCAIRFNFEDLSEVAGTTLTAVRKANSRDLFNHRDLESIIVYVIKTRKKKKLPELG